MKVALLSFGTKGGTGQYSAKLANGISKHIECHALVPSSHSELQMYDDCVNLHQFNTKKYIISDKQPKSRYPVIAYQIIKKLKQINPDVVHLPFYFRMPSLFSVPLVKFLQQPVIATVHDPISHGGDEIGPYGTDLLAYMRMITANLLDCVIVHGKRTKQQAISIGYSKHKIKTIPHGMYDQFGQSNGEEEITNPPTILFFGHLSKYRGTDRITKIANSLENSYENFQIKVAGSMSDERQQTEWGRETLAKLRNHRKISLNDEYIPESKVKDLFTEASIVLLPYYDATMSGVVMTAYSFATPIVATDTGDLGWIIDKDESGLLASPDSIQQIADKIEILLSNDKFREGIRLNILNAREQYDWETIGASTVELYKELLN